MSRENSTENTRKSRITPLTPPFDYLKEEPFKSHKKAELTRSLAPKEWGALRDSKLSRRIRYQLRRRADESGQVDGRGLLFEVGMLGTFPTATRKTAMCSHLASVTATEAVESTRMKGTTRNQTGVGISSNRCTAKATYPAQMDLQWPAVLRRLNGCHERDFVMGTSPTLTRLFTPDIGIIHFNATGQFLFTLALYHHLHQLVFELPGRSVVHANLTRQLQGRDTFFSLGQKIDGQKPFLQSQLCAMKNGAIRR